MAKKWKGFNLLISPETHRRISVEVEKVEGQTKTQWIREAISEKLTKNEEKK